MNAFIHIRDLAPREAHSPTSIQLLSNKYTGNLAVRKSMAKGHLYTLRELHFHQCLQNCSVLNDSVIQYNKVYATNDEQNFLMPYYSQGTLSDKLHPKLDPQDFHSIFNTNNPADVEGVWKILVQLLDCIAFLHNTLNIAHRDIKSENILLDDEGNLVLVDFDRSNFINDNPFTTRGVGTPFYCAPEIFETAYDESIDLYSIGILLYESNTGIWPYVPFEKSFTPGNDWIAELQRIMQETEPDYSKVDFEFRDVIRGFISNAAERKRTYKNLLNDGKVLQKMQQYKPKRSRYCTITPSKDCDILIISDKCKEELDLFVKSKGNFAQALLLHPSHHSVRRSYYRDFIIHLSEFVLEGSGVKEVLFEMADQTLSSTLFNCYYKIDTPYTSPTSLVKGDFKKALCRFPKTCIYYYSEVQARTSAGINHLSEFAHYCRFDRKVCPLINDEQHLLDFHHLDLKRCYYGIDCYRFGNPEHRFKYYHDNVPIIPTHCPTMDNCSLKNDIDHLKKFGHWNLNSDSADLALFNENRRKDNQMRSDSRRSRRKGPTDSCNQPVKQNSNLDLFMSTNLCTPDIDVSLVFVCESYQSMRPHLLQLISHLNQLDNSLRRVANKAGFNSNFEIRIGFVNYCSLFHSIPCNSLNLSPVSDIHSRIEAIIPLVTRHDYANNPVDICSGVEAALELLSQAKATSFNLISILGFSPPHGTKFNCGVDDLPFSSSQESQWEDRWETVLERSAEFNPRYLFCPIGDHSYFRPLIDYFSCSLDKGNINQTVGDDLFPVIENICKSCYEDFLL
ncbi:hypothetical protein P9112_004717 [Eukaryota sp. TZLM1-RC]